MTADADADAMDPKTELRISIASGGRRLVRVLLDRDERPGAAPDAKFIGLALATPTMDPREVQRVIAETMVGMATQGGQGATARAEVAALRAADAPATVYATALVKMLVAMGVQARDIEVELGDFGITGSN